jgi:hypothetical protein
VNASCPFCGGSEDLPHAHTLHDHEIFTREFGPTVAAPISKIIETERGVTAAQAGLPGSSGSSKADERANTEHNGAQEHNAAICREDGRTSKDE